jgi:hypothetical protein
MKRLNLKAVLIGCLFDWGGTFGFTLASLISLGIMAGIKGLSEHEIQSAYLEWSKSDPGMILSLLYGSGFTFLGGYVAARIAKSGNLFNSCLVGVIGILPGLFFVSDAPDTIFLLSALVSVPAAVLGGICHSKKWVLIWSEEATKKME